MKLSIDHQTNYYYKELAQRSVQYIRMSPMPLAHQTIHSWSVMLPKLATLQQDGFGNTWFTLSRNEKHDNLQIQATGIVEINTQTESIPDSGDIPYLLFTVQTPLTQCSQVMREFAAPYLESVNIDSLRDFAKSLINRMPYTKNATHVGTTAKDSFDLGAGVCQDHSHVFIGCLRDQKIPARYVSGYLYDVDQNHMSSHAWAEAYLDGNWYTFDISNQLFQPSHHVYVAIGRDYLDTAPVRGVRIGGGYESLYSQVMVHRIE
ncbi:transglutaminase family protein [Psychrobacter sp.]|uniref:transglutaminase family protein n=1 Tax=Psychrobacter sp. TaxID=56811 RepID=UPI0025D9E06C|nr:transglutaminase family protein [Psychrobacter sp.]